MRDFKQLKVWEKANKVAVDIYNLTKTYPKEVLYGITSQIRRAAISVPTNIVEGSGRETSKEFSRFLSIAAGSACEAEYLIMFSKELYFINEATCSSLLIEINEIKKMLNSFQRKLNSKD